MKNRFIFIVGLILLIIIVWATTMFAINYNSKKEEQAFVVACNQNIDNISLKK